MLWLLEYTVHAMLYILIRRFGMYVTLSKSELFIGEQRFGRKAGMGTAKGNASICKSASLWVESQTCMHS